MRLFKLVFSFSLLLTLIGCATVQQPMPLSSNIFNDTKRVGVVFTEAPTAETQYLGDIGLLDYAIISSANTGLDEYLATLPFDEYQELQNSIVTKLKNKGVNIVVIDKAISSEERKNLKSPSEGKSKNDFSRYKSEYNLDMLMLIDFRAIGTIRNYYSFIPTSEPQTRTVINGQLIDLSTNDLHWYSNALSIKDIPEPWDEPDNNYPNLTTSLYQSLNEVIQVLNYELDGNGPLNIKSAANSSTN